MKRKNFFILFLLLACLSLMLSACSSDDSSTDGDDPADGDDPMDGDRQQCSADGGDEFGGMIKAECDKVVGVCENAVSVPPWEYYPCVDDPDCCCDSDNAFAEMPDVYPCEFASCVDDGYCDEGCPSSDEFKDPDCD